VSTAALHALRQRLLDTILGSDRATDLLLTALLARGHALVTGPPGLGKTTLAHTLADSIGGSFKRLQFTPDLLPSDILGYNLYRQQNGEFDFITGPVFSNLLLADEINRASPRTQSALLEAMNERQVSIDGITRRLPEPFLVVATQNDTSSTGTFPLPEPQLDRFLLSIPITLPGDEIQLEILKLHNGHLADANGRMPADNSDDSCILHLDALIELQNAAASLPVSDNLQRYLLALCQTTRALVGNDNAVSVRATLNLQRAAQAHALLNGQAAVHPDHVQAVFPHVLSHRLLSDDAPDPGPVLQSALDQTPVP
jgi:MoxR-like ATPase